MPFQTIAKCASLLAVSCVLLLTIPGSSLASSLTADLDHLPAASQNSATLQQIPSNGSIENPCPDGEYLNLQTDACIPLDRQYGFDAQLFAENMGSAEYTLDECSDDALQELFDEIEDQGGIVTLPACTMNVDRRLVIPSNVILQGAGMGETILQTNAEFTETLLQVRHASNAIIRDITLDGRGGSNLLLSSWYADNVLIERVEARQANGTGINFRYAQRVTIRYSSSHDNGSWHGIASKDCFPGEEDVDDLDECIEEFGEKLGDYTTETTPGVLWSQNFAIYSNHLYDNGGYGLDLHASEGEIAGNLIESNGYGTKFPDSSRLWIHHNLIQDNRWWGAFLYGTVEIEERASKQLLFYANTFGRNGMLQMRIHAPVQNVYLILNEYTGLINTRYVTDAQLYLCKNGQDTRVFTYGTRPIGINPEQCTLDEASTVFSD